MKRILLLVLFAAVCSSEVIAQTSMFPESEYFSTARLNMKTSNISLFEAPHDVQRNARYIKTYEHWRKLRNNVIVLTALGAACITVGAVLISADVVDYDGKADGTRSLFGAMGIAGGITSVGGGVTMWAIGQNRLNKLGGVSIKAMVKI